MPTKKPTKAAPAKSKGTKKVAKAGANSAAKKGMAARSGAKSAAAKKSGSKTAASRSSARSTTKAGKK